MASFPRSVRKNDIDVPHRLDKLLKRKPNPYQSPFSFWRTLYFAKYHYANGYAEIERDSLFNVAAIHNRPPEIVSPFRWIEDDGSISQWYIVGGLRPHVVPSQDFIHLSNLSYDGMVGINHVWLHQETFERSSLINRYVTRYLVKGSVIRGAIEIDATATDAQVETILNNLRRAKGADAEDDTLLLTGGAKFNNKSADNQQSQIIQLSQLSTKQIAQLTDVPSHFLLDDSDGKYNANPIQAGEDVVRYLFRLEIEQAEDELLKLLSDAEQDAGFTIHIDPNALIRGDVVTESNIVVALKTAGIITNNDARIELGYPPTDDPEDDKLKTLGDTAPAVRELPTPTTVSEPSEKSSNSSKPKASIEQFRAILGDVGSRVDRKTVKATETHQAKAGSDPEGFTVWGNVFAAEQATYAAQSLAPILETIQSVIGEPVQATAGQIGERYAHRLRTHFALIKRNEKSESPNLQTIIQEMIGGTT